MSERVAVIWDDRVADYHFGPGHPLDPIRLTLAMRLSEEFGLFEYDNVDLVGPVELASDADLLRVHDPDFVDAVKRDAVALRYGLGTSDNPVFEGMHAASARVAGGTLLAASLVHEGAAEHAVNLVGGLHHAMPNRAHGFCIYNDIAVSIGWLLDQGVERVAYVDVDVHHGDGVQEMFVEDPRVMTISVHESPRTLFPRTGWAHEIGRGMGLGTSVNLALPAGTDDRGWLRGFFAIVPQLLEAFAPQILLTQHGVDSHRDDPLAHLMLSVDGQRQAYEALHRYAHQFAGGRWVAVGGGGYEWVDVVPRAWTHLIAEAAGHPIHPMSEIPSTYQAYVDDIMGRAGPERMTDGVEHQVEPIPDAFDPGDPVDQAIIETRAAVFPHWGLSLE